MPTIGTLARHSGTRGQSVRHGERIGLMPAPGRTARGQRRRDAAVPDRGR